MHVSSASNGVDPPPPPHPHQSFIPYLIFVYKQSYVIIIIIIFFFCGSGGFQVGNAGGSGRFHILQAP